MRIPLLALLLALPAAGADCVKAYKPEHQAQWELSRQVWEARCAKGDQPAVILAEAQKAFIHSCVADAQASVAAGLLAASETQALCAQGAPGRERIPKAARSSPEKAGQLSPTLAPTTGRLDAVTGRIGAAVGGDVASLYGDVTRDAGGDLVSAGASGGLPTPEPSGGGRAPAAGGKDLKTNAPPEPPYEPTDKTKAPHLKTLDSRFDASGVGDEGARFARQMYRETIESLPVEVLKNLVDNKVNVVVIPKDKKLTDVPPFTVYKGRSLVGDPNPDKQRTWDDIKGIANVSDGKGNLFTAIPEENLIGASNTDSRGFPKRFTFLHEVGHSVHLQGLHEKVPPVPSGFSGTIERARRLVYGEPPSQAEVQDIYNESMKRTEKTGLGSYADANENEFFGQAAAAYHGVGQNGETAETLKAKNPKMYDLMRRIYGAPDRYKPK